MTLPFFRSCWSVVHSGILELRVLSWCLKETECGVFRMMLKYGEREIDSATVPSNSSLFVRLEYFQTTNKTTTSHMYTSPLVLVKEPGRRFPRNLGENSEAQP